MKTTLIFFLLVVACSAQSIITLLSGSPPASGAATYLIQQGFETPTTGYDNGETWATSSGTPDPDNTTSPAPLVGSQSLRLPTASAAGRVRTDFADQTEAWFYCQAHFPSGSDPGGDRDLVAFSENGGATLHYRVIVTSTRKLKVGTLSTTDSVPLDTLVHIWFRAKQGTGANAELAVEFSTDGVRVGSGTKYQEFLTGTATALIGRLWIGYTAAIGFDMVVDKVRVDDVAIGSNPS